MLDDLISLTKSLAFEEYGSIQLQRARLEADVLKLSLKVYPGDSDKFQFWQVECIGCSEHRISLGLCYEFGLHFDHVLLWPYIYPECSLSFYGEAEDPYAVAGALHERHVELVKDWIPLGRFMNGNPVKMIRGRFGMLADGPTPLVNGYEQVLESFCISSRMTEPKAARYTNDQSAGLAEVGVLILNKESYVVAGSFQAHSFL